ncbi:MAG: CopG family transcriptional regulator [Acidobacteria bacterium]|nr:CopG family transcriptional regulator [Acidobacteriota bacterium]MCI0725101.1 CopG family transcriptional regulator [Acidobacteriota bacterium]
MRTTLDIDEDILAAAKELARQRGLPAGKVLSNLARKGLSRNKRSRTRNGVSLFPARPRAVVTLELVNRLQDERP